MKNTINNKKNNKFFIKSVLLVLVSICVSILCIKIYEIKNVQAAGSKSVSTTTNVDGEDVYNEGYRGFLEYFDSNQSNKTATILRQQLIYIYANKGEEIYFGSSVYNSQLGSDHLNKGKVTGCDIMVISPSGIPVEYDVQNTTSDKTGYIYNKTLESQGPVIEGYNEEGYIPLKFTAEETGVYTFHFHSPTGKTGTTVSKQLLSEENILAGQGQGWEVSAWDVTVFNREENLVVDGRMFTNFLALTTNFNQTDTTQPAFYSKVYVVTNDGYIYETDFNGIDPYGFLFFANNRGIINTETNTPLYKSFYSKDNQISDIGTYKLAFHHPNMPDTEQDFTYKIFFSKPDPELIGSYIPVAYEPTAARNFKFIGTSGEDGTHVGVGGYFTFDVDNATSATITIDMTHIVLNDGTKHDYGIVTLNDTVSPGQTNSFFWDGHGEELLADGTRQKVMIPVGSYDSDSIIVSLDTHAGEYHLPLLDVENSVNGIIVDRISDIKANRNVKIDSATGYIYCENGIIRKLLDDGTTQKFSKYDKATFDTLPWPSQQMEMDVSDEYEKTSDNLYYNNKDIIAALDANKNPQRTFVADGQNHSHSPDCVQCENCVNGPVSSKTGDALKFTNLNGDRAILDVWTYAVGERTVTKLINDINIIEDKETVITGQVFFDFNNNGLFSISDHDYALNKVKVTLSYHPFKTEMDENGNLVKVVDEFNNYIVDDSVTLVKETITDVTGKYYFSGIPYNLTTTENACTITIEAPNQVFTVTTGNKSSNDFINLVNGTATQNFVIGYNGINPENVKQPNIMQVSDVGYYAKNVDQKMTINKDWRLDRTFDEKRPSSITITVKGIAQISNGEDYIAYSQDYILDEFSSWRTNINNLPKYYFDNSGKSYTLKYIVSDERFEYDGVMYHYTHNYKEEGDDYYYNYGDGDEYGYYYKTVEGEEIKISSSEYPYKTKIVNCKGLIFGAFNSSIVNAPKQSTLQITKRSTDDTSTTISSASFNIYKVVRDADGNPVIDPETGKEVLELIELGGDTGMSSTGFTDVNGLLLFSGNGIEAGEYVIEANVPEGYVNDSNKKTKVFVNVHIPAASDIPETEKVTYVFPENQLITIYNRPIKTAVSFTKTVDYFKNTDNVDFDFTIQYALEEGILEKYDQGIDVSENIVMIPGKVSISSGNGLKEQTIALTITDENGTREVSELKLPSNVYIRILEQDSTDYNYSSSKSQIKFLSQESSASQEVVDASYTNNEIFHIVESGTYTFNLVNELKEVPDMYYQKLWIDKDGKVLDTYKNKYNANNKVYSELPAYVQGVLEYSIDNAKWYPVTEGLSSNNVALTEDDQKLQKNVSGFNMYTGKYSSQTYAFNTKDENGNKIYYRFRETESPNNYVNYRGTITYNNATKKASFTNPVTGKTETVDMKYIINEFQNNYYVVNYALLDKNVVGYIEDRQPLLATSGFSTQLCDRLKEQSIADTYVWNDQKITYMIKVNARDLKNGTIVSVSDSIPEGCTYVTGSAKVYSENLSSNTYKLKETTNAVAFDGQKLSSDIKITSTAQNYYLIFDVTVDNAESVNTIDKIANTANASISTDSYTSNTVENYINVIDINIDDQEFIYNANPVSYKGTASYTDSDGIHYIDGTNESENKIKYYYRYRDPDTDEETGEFILGYPTDAGRYTIKAVVEATSEHPYAEDTALLIIKPLEIVVTAENKEMFYYDDIPTLTYKVEGLLGNDELLTPPTISANPEKSDGYYVGGKYDIIPENADAGPNYKIKYINGKLKVKIPLDLGVSFDNNPYKLLVLGIGSIIMLIISLVISKKKNERRDKCYKEVG